MRRRKNNLYYNTNKKKKSFITKELISEIISWISITAIAIVIAIALVTAFGMQVKVIGDSMEETLNNGQGILIDRVLSRIASPKKGDIIVFLPNGNKNSHYYVKRIVATSGDTVQIIDGRLYLNNQKVDEGNAYDTMQDAGIAENAIKLSSGEYFVLGDNRNSSEDSRSANIGIVRQNMIVGKAWFKLKSDNASGGFIMNDY
ncbi:MAG: signal peptidase I [Butyrivibrio sp.]|nr:signal peptidase I [Butyrivibrio sp.]